MEQVGEARDAAVPQIGADAAVIRVMPVGQVDSGAPADLSGHIADRGQCARRAAGHRPQVDVMLHQAVQHADGVKPLPAAALQHHAAFGDLTARSAGRKFVDVPVNVSFHGI